MRFSSVMTRVWTLVLLSVVVLITPSGAQQVDPAEDARPARPEGGPPGGRGGPGPGGGQAGQRGPRTAAAKTLPANRPLQDLWIPPLVEGKNLELTLSANTKNFAGVVTPTLGYNKNNFWGPTIVFNQGEVAQIKVKNDTKEVTTVHWHGLHIPAVMDGGPHQLIPAGGTWTPTFKIMNNAGTFWYHPHPHELSQKQITLGAGGLIIVHDPQEAKLSLPRTYGVDDIPLVLTSRRFKTNNQFSYDGDNDKYGDYQLVNGTLDPQVKLPSQWVRLRILNAEIERGYNLGFADGRTFYLITSDGGLVDKPVPLKKIRLMVGERAEIMVDLSADKPGSSLDLMTYNANQPFGFPGGEPGQTAPNGGLLNNLDYRVLKINVGAATSPKIAKLPDVLTHNRFPVESEATNKRTITVTRGTTAEFSLDGKSFDMHTTNQVVKLGSTEIWTVTNSNVFGHAFHVHDVQFKLLTRTKGTIADYEQGWKDTVYLPRGTSLTFIAKFEDFASDTDPFMYHCHMANHEDGGMMGQFIVSANPAGVKRDSSGLIRFRDKVDHPLTAKLIATAAQQTDTIAAPFEWQDASGKTANTKTLNVSKPMLLYFIEKECPCSRDAAVFINQLQSAYGNGALILGIINADANTAKEWTKTVGANFTVIADPNFEIINAYKASRSASTILVAPGGLITKSNPGYSAEIMKELSTRLAQFIRVPERALKLESAPEKLTSGCPLQ
jgi:bilirubin oxidase